VLSEFELGLLEMYKLLESSSGPRAVAAVSDDKAKQKAFLLAQALERERVEAEQRERQKQAAAMRRKRQNPDSEPHNKEDNKEGRFRFEMGEFYPDLSNNCRRSCSDCRIGR
jgi:hypothetical protein